VRPRFHGCLLSRWLRIISYAARAVWHPAPLLVYFAASVLEYLDATAAQLLNPDEYIQQCLYAALRSWELSHDRPQEPCCRAPLG